jgi:hypothetical protein
MDSELAAADKPQAVGKTTLGRMCEIEAGKGPPPTAQEQADRARAEVWYKANVAPHFKDFLRRRPVKPRIHAPERREPVAQAARPRERRVRRSHGSASRGDPSEPPPARPPLTAAERNYLRARIDARRREVVRATDKVERSLERHWRESAA